MCCPRNGKQVPRDFIVDAATVFSYHCAQAWEGQTATLASPDTGQKVEATGLPSLLFNLAYGDVGRLSTKENIVMRFPVSRHAAAPLLAFALASPALADPAIESLLVTATRTPQHTDEVILDATVSSNEEIARAGAGSVADLHASVDLRDPRDATTGKQLARRARRHASLAASHAIDHVDLGAELQASGSRVDDAANANRLGGYGLLNLYTTWRCTPDWSLLLCLDNTFDKRYDLARNDGTAGRSWFAALRYGIR